MQGKLAAHSLQADQYAPLPQQHVPLYDRPQGYEYVESKQGHSSICCSSTWQAGISWHQEKQLLAY